jgi:3-oxoacyl-[acyl-carrier-protein] synthase-3
MSAKPSAIGLLGLGAYVPERVMTNDEWAAWVDTSDEWIRQRTGIERRRIVADDESTATLAVAAGLRALADAGLEPRDVDEIIVATDTPEVYLPDTSSFVQVGLGARNVPAYTLGGSGCAGFLQALDVARSRVASGRERVLVIGAELLTRLMNWRDRNTCVLFGDAAAAAVVGRGAAVKEILACVAGTDGGRADILMLEMGGTRVPFTAEGAASGRHQAIVMKGREVFKEAVARMTEASLAVLALAGRRLEEVALVVPHQANLRIIDAVGKALGVAPERVFVNVQDYGNTGSASVPLALTQARDQGRIAPGDLVLLTSFGAGFHWASALVQF